MKQSYIDAHLKNIKEYVDLCTTYLNLIPEDHIWNREILPSGNSAGELINHLIGNMTQYVVSSIGGAPDIRNRESEFTIGKQSKEELIEHFNKTIKKVIQIINDLPLDDRDTITQVQCFSYTKYQALIASVAYHFSYHVGQIALIGMHFKGGGIEYFGKYKLDQTN